MAAGPGPDVAARVAGLLATIAANAARADEAIAWARRALEHSIESGTDASYAMTMLVSGWALQGDLRAGEEEVAGWAARLGATANGPDVCYARGVLALWSGRFADAERFLTPLVEDHHTGPGLIAASARYSLADCWYRQGRWDEALAMAVDLARLLDDSGQLLSSPMAHGVAASVLAARGEIEEAQRHLRAAERAMARRGTSPPGCGCSRPPPASRSPPTTTRPSSRRCSRWPTHCVRSASRRARNRGAPTSSTRSSGSDGSTTRSRELADLIARTRNGGAHARRRRVAGVERRPRGARRRRRAAEVFAAALAEDAATQGSFARARLELAAGAFERRRGRRRVAADLLDRAASRSSTSARHRSSPAARQERAACAVDARPPAGARPLTKAERRSPRSSPTAGRTARSRPRSWSASRPSSHTSPTSTTSSVCGPGPSWRSSGGPGASPRSTLMRRATRTRP